LAADNCSGRFFFVVFAAPKNLAGFWRSNQARYAERQKQTALAKQRPTAPHIGR